MKKIFYAKGGNAVAEGAQLFPLAGSMPKGGPDQFLLSVLSLMKADDQLKLASFGSESLASTHDRFSAVEYAARPKGKTRLVRTSAFLFTCLRFFVDVLRYRPNVVISGVEGIFGAVAAVAARVAGARFVFSVHNALRIDSVTGLNKFCNRLACRLATKVLVHGPFLKDQVLGFGVDSQKILEYNSGFDIPAFDRILSVPPAADEAFSFIYVGRIEADKGVFDLLQAFVKCRESHHCKLHYVGGGSDAVALSRAIEESGCAADIKMHGSLPHEDALKLMHSCSVVVTPTKSTFPEGRCKSAMEAFLLGKPVIAPDYGPFPYLVASEKNGILYEPDSVSDLSVCMSRLIDDRDLYELCRENAFESAAPFRQEYADFHECIVLAVRG